MSTAPQQVTPLQSLEGIVNRLLQLAARIGRHGKDGVDVSYTSLFTALLWLEDDTSKWLTENISKLEVKLSAVYQTRGVAESDKAALREAAFSKEELSPLSYSPSARRVLAAAQEVASEVSGTEPGLVSTRHIAAVYFFRNPPDHQTQLESEWRFDLARWRPSFLEFINRSLAAGEQWETFLAPHLDPQLLEMMPVILSDRYRMDSEAGRIIEIWWENSEASTGPQRLLRSAGLFQALGGRDSFGMPATGIESGVDGNPHPAVSMPNVITAGSRLVLDEAQSLAFSTTSSAEIGVRHLAAAVILVKESGAHRELLSSGEALGQRRQKLLNRIIRHNFEDDVAQWRKTLIGQRPPDLTFYRADDPEAGEDQLDVKRFATAFSLLIASKDVVPPLAIGISGNWGSGKSFFMRLMRKETERITGLAAADPRFHSNVVPVQFNAWHYAEKDLLASLVQTIFQTLRVAMLAPQGGTTFAEAAETRLAAARRAKEQADQEVAAAQAAVALSAQRVADARTSAEHQAEAAKLNAAEVAAASAVHLNAALRALGLGHLEKLIVEGTDRMARVREAIRKAESTGLRTRSAWRWLLIAPVHWPSIFAALVILGITGVLLWWFRNEIQSAWPAALAVLTELGTAGGLIWRWANRHLRQVDAALDSFESVRDAIEAKAAEKREVIAGSVDEAESALKADQAKLKLAQESVAAAGAVVQEAERAAEETKSINQLARFVDGRLDARDYEKYLGLVAAVRADFQLLSKMLHDAANEAQDSNLSFRRIDRIVLYIDDLDRCPTDKVILVLEAIHLLLAFDLFVVVVGLDIRWASHSLEEKFSKHLLAEGGATALDYLEKIFQVPFWLPPMDEQASRQLLATMLPGQPAAVEHVRRRQPVTPARNDEETRAKTQQGTPVASGTAAAGSVQETELLTIQRGERAFMLQLAPAVSRSPRRLKRFVNTYLILRASLDPLERETFVLDGGARGNYREAMMLLALLTSAPRAWTRVLNVLESPNSVVNVGDLLNNVALRDVAPGEREYVASAFDVYRAGAESLEDLKEMAPKVARFSFHYSFS